MKADLYVQIEEQRLNIDAVTHILKGLDILITLHDDIDYCAELRAHIEDYTRGLIVSQDDLVLLEDLLANRENESQL